MYHLIDDLKFALRFIHMFLYIFCIYFYLLGMKDMCQTRVCLNVRR